MLNYVIHPAKIPYLYNSGLRTRHIICKAESSSNKSESRYIRDFCGSGAGQEVVRHFLELEELLERSLKPSAHTIKISLMRFMAKKKRLDTCATRLEKMLKHEYQLIEERINRENHPSKQFFAFANTVATINFHKSQPGTWMVWPEIPNRTRKEASEVILHARLHETDALQQQITTGILGQI